MKTNEELSYSQICIELGDKELKGGRQREKQFNRWNKVYKINKPKRGKYIIVRKLSNQEIQNIQDKDNYSQYLQNLLLNLFANQKEISQTYTYRDLREHLSMVNSHYFPVKYGKENLTTIANASINIKTGRFEIDESIVANEEEWFTIADNHDKDVLKYAINKLNEQNLVTVYPTYIFYKNEKTNENIRVLSQRIATKEEKAELDQIKLDITKSENKKSFNEIYRDKNLLTKYNKMVGAFLKGIGYDSYAKAYTVDRPANLKSVVDYFAPKFNSMQVIRYLNSKRFKMIPPLIHEHLTDELIKDKKLIIKKEDLDKD